MTDGLLAYVALVAAVCVCTITAYGLLLVALVAAWIVVQPELGSGKRSRERSRS